MYAATLSLLKWLLVIVLGLLVILISAQIIFRQLPVGASLGWTEEASRGLFVWMVMLGAALGVAERSHFAIQAIAKLFPEKLAFIPRVIRFGCMGAVALIFVIKGWPFLVKGLARVSLVTGLPLTWTFAAIFVSGLMMCIFLVHNLFHPAPDTSAGDPTDKVS
ncbi:TRAP transporter small permease [Oceanomicrobium pacificus]|uniref:TRAP transporter small permease protein n=1 Tax=Oceanomicrobium pacificus TaxID=2692916 RepID=A0A6B0TTR4_9RHOB|nr:TRAP transporter small permease subunit [Oceanomicrobium pacificus]MXU64353.1 TRAP transporter small permease subunit [Oceanomicrobium pacificus]